MPLESVQNEINSLTTLDEFLQSKDNSINHKFIKEIPNICKNEPCMLGVDEAGRGPVLGPMVYGIAFCPLEKKQILIDLGCADSKQLTEEKREEIFEEINQGDEAKSCIGWAVEVIAPNVISSSMYRRTKCSLNEVSMDSAIGLIQLAIDAGVNISEVYVDTVGPPEKYQAKLAKIFPNFSITVAKKADSTYPIVSAASICAKVTRDHALKMWKFKEGLTLTHEEFGSGYPADPMTKRFLSENIDPVFGFPRIVRFSWSTAETALEGKAYKVQLNEETEEEKQSFAFLQYFKSPKKEGVAKRKRPEFYKERCLETTTSFP